MLQILVSRLGGLLNRRIYHAPVSRDLYSNVENVNNIQAIYEDCMINGGVMLILPEHILSRQLMTIESTLKSAGDISQAQLATEDFLDQHSRYLVDESDEIFNARYEQVYPIGAQRPIEYAPIRWQIIQRVLDFLFSHVPDIKKRFPTSIEVKERDGKLPRVRILEKTAATELSKLIANDIINDVLGTPVHLNERTAFFNYMTQKKVKARDKEKVESSETWRTDQLKSCVLLARGLLAVGVLEHVLRNPSSQDHVRA